MAAVLAHVKSFLDHHLADVPKPVLIGVTAFLLVSGLFMLSLVYFLFPKTPRKVPQNKRKYTDATSSKRKDYYDVAIVGGGPSGSTCAYYMANGGNKNVLVLEKKQFPRDKYCGDAVCKTAIEILMEMNLYQKLIDENKAKIADHGGLVSPSGLSFIGRSAKIYGAVPAAIAIKRLDLDEAIARRAQEVGADLKENKSVENAVFDETTGLWTVTCEDKTSYKARVLVCADGAPSRLATKLGMVTRAPDGTCSRAFIKGGTHKLDSDGVVFYNKDMLPGYAAIFKHPNDELNFCAYLIPGNPDISNDDLKKWHTYLIEKDPYVSAAIGKNAVMEEMRPGSLRLGGENVTSGKHVIVIGDAAGHIDPMTGEGIHHAMEGGKIAAQFLAECIKAGNYDADTMRIWHERWFYKFGFDFSWSYALCRLQYRFPILVDAATAAVKRKGDQFLVRWADIMTGRVPKVHLLRPEFVIVIGFEMMILLTKKLFGRPIGPVAKKAL